MLLGVNYSTGAVFNATPVRACHAPDVFFQQVKFATLGILTNKLAGITHVMLMTFLTRTKNGGRASMWMSQLRERNRPNYSK